MIRFLNSYGAVANKIAFISQALFLLAIMLGTPNIF
jgi:hypothetical protein